MMSSYVVPEALACDSAGQSRKPWTWLLPKYHDAGNGTAANVDVELSAVPPITLCHACGHVRHPMSTEVYMYTPRSIS